MIHDLLRIDSFCNQSCLFCNVDFDCRLKTENAKNELFAIEKNGGKIVSITGGEPTLREDLGEIIEFAKNNTRLKIDLQTNATLCTPDFSSTLSKKGLDSAFVSLHSRDAKLSDKLTQLPGSFSKTVQGILNLQSEGIKVSLNTVVNSLNYRDLAGFVEFVATNFPMVHCLNFSVVQPAGRALKNKWLVPKYSEIKPNLLEAAGLCKSFGLSLSNPFCGVPPCFFTGFEEYCLEVQIANEKPVAGRKTIENAKQEKIKGKLCGNCAYDYCCAGVWKNYAAIYGTSELKPVT